MATIRANDLDIGYDVRGDGPPLILLHAATATGRATFGPQLAELETRFRLYLPDARGHGRTRWDPDDGFRAGWLVDDVAAFAEALGLEQAHIMGFSMGGMTALGYAVRRPERVASLVAVGIATAREPRASVARRMMDPARIERSDPAWAADLTRTHDPVQGTGTWRRLLPAVAEDVATQPLLTPAELRGITAPTLVACGDRDPLVPVSQAAELARQVCDGRLFVAPGCGHDILHDRPGLVREALATFYGSADIVDRRSAGRPETPTEVRG